MNLLPWLLCGTLILLLGLSLLANVGLRAVYGKRLLQVLTESEKLNQRWKLATEALVLWSKRDTVFEEREWSDEEEDRYQKSLEALTEQGVSLESIGFPVQETPRRKKPKVRPESLH
jgi:hypothetical protein